MSPKKKSLHTPHSPFVTCTAPIAAIFSESSTSPALTSKLGPPTPEGTAVEPLIAGNPL